MYSKNIPANNHDMHGYQFTGEHIIAEIYDVPDQAIHANDFLHESLKSASFNSGATILEDTSINFHPSGCTSYIVFAESHASIHTYPENKAIFFDAFTCGTTLQPIEILNGFCKKIGAKNVTYKSINRGHPPIETNQYNQKKVV